MSNQEKSAEPTKDIVSLGDGQVFVKRTPDGQIKAVKSSMTLEEANGEIAIIENKAMTTAKGFYHANQIASLSIITPEKITLPDGKIVVNPFPILDPVSGSISKIWVKKMCMGYGPIGNFVITSATLLYDIQAYFIQDLVKKVKKSVACGKICVKEQLSDEELKKGIFYPIDGMFGVWADVSQVDILTCISTYVNKKLFAERNAQTICERVAMQKHPALSHIAYVNALGPEKKTKATVTVFGYVHDFTQKQMTDMAAKAERGEEISIDGETAEVIEEVATATEIDAVLTADDEEVISAETGNSLFEGGKTF